jgi:hypothetical protein
MIARARSPGMADADVSPVGDGAAFSVFIGGAVVVSFGRASGASSCWPGTSQTASMVMMATTAISISVR